jgi:hypothetical protein
MSQQNSGSHYILSLEIHVNSPDSPAHNPSIGSLVSTIRLVELAGSDKDPMGRGIAYRAGLSAFESVMSDISLRKARMSYSDSKLTHILRDSLDTSESNLMILVLAHISGEIKDFDEDWRTLQFVQRASGFFGDSSKSIGGVPYQKAGKRQNNVQTTMAPPNFAHHLGTPRFPAGQPEPFTPRGLAGEPLTARGANPHPLAPEPLTARSLLHPSNGFAPGFPHPFAAAAMVHPAFHPGPHPSPFTPGPHQPQTPQHLQQQQQQQQHQHPFPHQQTPQHFAHLPGQTPPGLPQQPQQHQQPPMPMHLQPHPHPHLQPQPQQQLHRPSMFPGAAALGAQMPMPAHPVANPATQRGAAPAQGGLTHRGPLPAGAPPAAAPAAAGPAIPGLHHPQFHPAPHMAHPMHAQPHPHPQQQQQQQHLHHHHQQQQQQQNQLRAHASIPWQPAHQPHPLNHNNAGLTARGPNPNQHHHQLNSTFNVFGR